MQDARGVRRTVLYFLNVQIQMVYNEAFDRNSVRFGRVSKLAQSLGIHEATY
jgi:hypothetical protein